MKLVLLLSVVAFVAGQQYPGVAAGYPAPYGTQGPCGIYGRQRFGINARYQCCRPERNGGCGQIRQTNYPSYGQPPQNWLRRVCCTTASTCCPQFMNARPQNLNYQCCNSGESCQITDQRGVCVSDGNNTAPVLPGEQIDGYGRCPDGALPHTRNSNNVVKCTLNMFLPGFGNQCPSNFKCILDYSGNANSGVCCPQTGCDEKANCTGCVSTPTSSFVPNGCQWLTQGDLYTPLGKCVTRCDHFPGRSCIIGKQTVDRAEQLCPFNTDNPRGANFSTGTCLTRCGLIGTGRSDRINNGTDPTIYLYNTTLSSACGFLGGAFANNKTIEDISFSACHDLCDSDRVCGGYSHGVSGGIYNSVTGVYDGEIETCLIYFVGVTSPNLAAPLLIGTGFPILTIFGANCHAKNGTLHRPLKCCIDYPGDPCCDTYGQRADHCVAGRIVGGPACGVPVQGTINSIAAPYYPPFRRQNQGRRRFMQPTFNARRPFYLRSANEGAEQGMQEEPVGVDGDSDVFDKWHMRMPYFRIRGSRRNNQQAQPWRRNNPVPFRDGRGPQGPPAPISQLPGPAVCSCDNDCRHNYDCCQDYVEYCFEPTVNTTNTTAVATGTRR
jgi:hypothetical protein